MAGIIKSLYYCLMKCVNWVIPHFCKVIYVGEYVTDRNFGDALNFVLLKKITHRKLIPQRYCFKSQYEGNENLLFIGSTIRTSTSKSIIWGAGAISREDKVEGIRKVLSVRGPLTRDLLVSQGYDCPDLYGDPALLLPMFYEPQMSSAHYRIGFIPHFLDKGKTAVSYISGLDDVHTIDIQMPRSIFKPSINRYYKKFVDEVNSCDIIIASCLHGLIIADAYKKPTLWLKFGNDIGGDDIKFFDYYESIGLSQNDIKPVFIHDTEWSSQDLCKLATLKPVENIDIKGILSLNPYR